MANFSKTLTEAWLYSLKKNTPKTPSKTSPNYWIPDASSLLTTSQPLSFTLGTGTQILSTVLSKCSQTTTHEVLIVTCFWATSPSQIAISTFLLSLSAKALFQNRKFQVRICFSSRSTVQKLFQTSSLNGKVYMPEEWVALGLPRPEELRGLEMEVKSVFVRPFSVMHPKFILVDRELAFMPSCNVSWENWFEGCIEMRGGIAEKLFDFWVAFWAQGKTDLPAFLPKESHDSNQSPLQVPSQSPETPPTLLAQTTFPLSPSLSPTPMQTLLLPSPHNPDPQFRIFTTPSPPPTPLNLFLLQAIAQAQSSIYIQTPNITCFPLLAALRSALSRGVSITLVTSSRLMILEQLVTAGTITEFEMWRLRRWYSRALGKGEGEDLEQGRKLGRLRIGYYHPREGVVGNEEPVKSHLKLVVVDEEVTVLGSGNMDRASWYTSQELGVAFFSKEVANAVKRDVDQALEGRVDYVC